MQLFAYFISYEERGKTMITPEEFLKRLRTEMQRVPIDLEEKEYD